MELQTLGVFKGEGFRKYFFPNKKVKAEAENRYLEYIKEQSDFELAMRSENSALLIDKNRNIKVISLNWFINGGWTISDWKMLNKEVKVVRIRILPLELEGSGKIGEYSLGGMLVGGITGAIVGGIIDSLKGPKTVDVSIRFDFGDGKLFNDQVEYYAVRKKSVELTEENIRSIYENAEPQFKILKKHFPGKVVFGRD